MRDNTWKLPHLHLCCNSIQLSSFETLVCRSSPSIRPSVCKAGEGAGPETSFWPSLLSQTWADLLQVQFRLVRENRSAAIPRVTDFNWTDASVQILAWVVWLRDFSRWQDFHRSVSLGPGPCSLCRQVHCESRAEPKEVRKRTPCDPSSFSPILTPLLIKLTLRVHERASPEVKIKAFALLLHLAVINISL